MSNKLTLHIESHIIEEAKAYAKLTGRSLSDIVEEYLKSLSIAKSAKVEEDIDPLVKSLWGSVKLPKEEKSYKELLQDALIEKYIQ
ncbi:MAG: hypothetical protein HUU34_12300 [Saprospiraceae bacterium]|nr:hypothetical protein [Saprospiraceae bacterium]